MRNANRRDILGGALAAVATGFPLSASAQAAKMRFYWWGNPNRDRRTRQLLTAYTQKSGQQFEAETTGWGDYWTKLATQTAGGNAPDMIQMDYRYLAEYAKRGVLLPMDSLMSLPDFSAAEKNCGKVDGKLYGVNLGSNSKSLVADTAVLEKVGLKSIDPKWTWDDFQRVGTELAKINPGKYWAASDNSREEQGFEQWLNQRGKVLYTVDNKIGFSKDDVQQWFDMWTKFRKAGITPPAEVGAIDTGRVEQKEISRGLAAMSWVNSNQLVAFQALIKSPLVLGMFPREKGGASGHYIKPSMLMSVSAKVKDPQAAAKLISYMVEDVEGGKILGVERGIPCSSKTRAALYTEIDAQEKAMMDFVTGVTKDSVPLPISPPAGAGEVQSALMRIADAVRFDKLSVADGAAQFTAEAAKVLTRST